MDLNQPARLLAVSVFAALVAAVVARLLVAWATRSTILLDRPNERSSHQNPTPRGGGLAILAGLLTVVLLQPLFIPVAVVPVRILIATLALGVLGFVDDVVGLPAVARLFAQIAIAASSLSPSLLVNGLPLPSRVDIPIVEIQWTVTLIWVVGFTNFFNFMDGLDGLAAGQAVIAATLVMTLSYSTSADLLAAGILGGCIGFLAYNWAPARLFMGDVGSLSIGYLLAMLPLIAPPPTRSSAHLAMMVTLAFFLFDPVVTLLGRIAKGKHPFRAHREHAYQRLLAPGEAHVHVTAGLLAASAVLAAFAFAGYHTPRFRWLSLLVAILFVGMEIAIAHRRQYRRSHSVEKAPVL